MRCRRHRTEHRTVALSGEALSGGSRLSVGVQRARVKRTGHLSGAVRLCPVRVEDARAVDRWRVRQRRGKHRTIVRWLALLSGAVQRARRSSRPLEMDGWRLKKGHVDGQRPPDRGHRTEPSVRCVLSGAPAQKTVGRANGSIWRRGYKYQAWPALGWLLSTLRPLWLVWLCLGAL